MLKFLNRSKDSLIAGLLILAIFSSFGLAQSFFPRYPNRLNYIIGELNQASQDLVYLNGKLKDSTESCNCKNAISQCEGEIMTCDSISPEVFGESCPDRKEIEKMQVEIRNKTDQISFLRNLLQKEMDSGLEAELETLREEEAEQLKNNLNEVLSSSEKIIAPALKNIEILNDAQYAVEKQCQADCEQGIPFALQACIFENLGEQNPIKFIFEVGASLEELELGEIGINEIGLNLPDKIGLSGIDNLADFKIPLSDIIITFPPTPTNELENLSVAPIIFHSPSPSLPEFGWANFSCPKLSSQTYQCQPKREGESNHYANFEWYIQTFSWLSEKCQEIPGMQDNYGALKEECFNKNNVHLTIIQQCDALWQTYYACLKQPRVKCSPPSGICARYNILQQECKNLFEQEGESAPSNCGINALKNKCSQLKEQGREEAPEACKLVPVFTKELEEPESESYQEAPISCPIQTISDNPDAGARLDCPLSISGLSGAIPKIKLPDIIIPDIRLPSFNFSPFLKVKLPNFIFEDLILSDLELCNLDDCLGLIPSLALEIPFPTLTIPPIEIPPFYGSVPTMPGLEPISLIIEMGKIEFPSIPIPLAGLDLANLITLDLQLPEIPLPYPEILLNFKGLDIDTSNMLLGLVASIIPIPSGCIGIGISGIPLVIAFPDYYFSWPRFPEIPNLCDNKYEFCENIKDSLNNDLVSKLGKIQKVFNQAVQNNLQKNLDKIAVLYEELIREHISENLEEISAKIKIEIDKSMQKAVIEDGLWKIPPAKVPLEGITIPMEKINTKLAKIPLEFPIPWPEKLKQIKLTKPISYQLPSIPLDDLSYTKEIELKVPGFQLPSLKFGIDSLGNYPSCEGQSPSGGNPYPINKIDANFKEVLGFDKKIFEFSEKINQVLE